MTVLESLYQQAENCGIAVEQFSLPRTKAVAVCLGSKCYIGLDRRRLASSCEEAECLAHELGHCRTGAFYAQGQEARLREERRAEAWAIRRLVPRERFQKALRKGCREVWEFAEELNLSCAFAEKVMLFYKK